jgi:hypothetical protein
VIINLGMQPLRGGRSSAPKALEQFTDPRAPCGIRHRIAWTLAWWSRPGCPAPFTRWAITSEPTTSSEATRTVRRPRPMADRRKTSQAGTPAGRAVDCLADKVGVPVAPCVLLHEVLPHHAHRDGLSGKMKVSSSCEPSRAASTAR